MVRIALRVRVFFSYGIFLSALMAFPGLLLYPALRSSRVGVCERGVFGHGGVQFQANVLLPRVSGGSISRGSVRREGKHRPHRQVEVRRDRADVRTERRKRSG